MKYYFSITHEDENILCAIEAENEKDAKNKFIKTIPDYVSLDWNKVEEVMSDYFETLICSYGHKTIDI